MVGQLVRDDTNFMKFAKTDAWLRLTQGLLGVQRNVAVHTYRSGLSIQSAESYVLGVVLKA